MPNLTAADIGALFQIPSTVLTHVFRSDLPLPKTKGLDLVHSALKSNAHKIMNVAFFPMEMFLVAQQYRDAQHIAAKTYPMTASAVEGLTATSEHWEDFSALAMSLAKSNSLFAELPTPSPSFNPEVFFELADQTTRDKFHHVFESMIFFGWTMFETLAGDLWEAAVNLRPQPLAQLRSKNGVQKSKPDSKQIELSAIEAFRFDIQHRMGTLLRNTDKVIFTKLPLIHDAYLRSFPENSPPLSPDIWESRNLKTAVALRNVFAHRAGRVDKDFIDAVQEDKRFSTFSVGSQIGLSGQYTADIVRSLIEISMQLFSSVDEWLATKS